ncbi:FitA-like ribbon-helix-helix domain-containing protein [Leifsonia sp. RAF41]|uniref:FitA-like ribbon-helix-helix domain-containing protein n=1 Tax=Leifsonia sp. RAF41 TaxID=3233056 RepID=UPI003F997973
MGVTVQVRDLDPAVNERLKGAAAAKGLSYSEFLRRELTRVAEKLRIDERWNELKSSQHLEAKLLAAKADLRRPLLDVSTEEIVQGIREDRDSR